MNKKVIVVSLLAALLVPATNGFAQGGKIVKNLNKLNSPKLRIVTQDVDRLAPRVSGVYIPAGTTIGALERKIAFTAQKAGVKLDKKDVRVIASHPKALRQFQVQTGMAIFEGRPLPYKKGIEVLQANQEKFADARANGEYEEKWTQFIEESDFVPFREGKSYGNPNDLANDVYNFYTKHINTENLPRVRENYVSDLEGIICEIPVDGLNIAGYFGIVHEVTPSEYVVIHYNNGSSHLVHRTQFGGNARMTIYRVIK